MKSVAWIFCLLMGLSVVAVAQQKEKQSLEELRTKRPALYTLVLDYADVFPDEEEQKLRRRLNAYQKETTTEIQVLTVPSLEGNDIKTVSLEIARQWKIGNKKHNNGILILLVQQGKQMRIELGRGVGQIIPNSEAEKLLLAVKPALKNERYSEATNALVDAIALKLGDTFKANPFDTINSLHIIFFLFIGFLCFILGKVTFDTLLASVINTVIWVGIAAFALLKTESLFLYLFLGAVAELVILWLIHTERSNREEQERASHKIDQLNQQIEEISAIYRKYDKEKADEWEEAQKERVPKKSRGFYKISQELDTLLKCAQDLEKVYPLITEDKNWRETNKFFQKLPNLIHDYKKKLVEHFFNIPYEERYLSAYFSSPKDRVTLPYFTTVFKKEDIKAEDLLAWLSHLTTTAPWGNYPVKLANKKEKNAELNYLKSKKEELEEAPEKAFLILDTILKRWEYANKPKSSSSSSSSYSSGKKYKKPHTRSGSSYDDDEDYNNYSGSSGSSNRGSSFDGGGSDISWGD